jgi:hypothetical protein
MVKENSGKAARNRQLRSLFTVIACCVTIIALYELSGLKNKVKDAVEDKTLDVGGRRIRRGSGGQQKM